VTNPSKEQKYECVNITKSQYLMQHLFLRQCKISTIIWHLVFLTIRNRNSQLLFVYQIIRNENVTFSWQLRMGKYKIGTVKWYLFLGKHEIVLLKVLLAQYEIGTINCHLFIGQHGVVPSVSRTMRNRKSQLKFIWKEENP